VFSTPGDVRGGDIQPIEIELPLELLADRVVIGTIDECHEKLGAYADLGLDEMVVNMSFGTPHQDVLASMERLARHVMPHLKRPTDQGAKVDA
jgi:alkanesulfonate monooxygenase SsuD/methylene tetrahydromethanopterin reductase-like flavin-dependent oxidoreductase (luciferase family)